MTETTEVERDLTPAHFHWVVVIARAAAAAVAEVGGSVAGSLCQQFDMEVES